MTRASSSVDDHEVPGLAGERTDMAWSRSGLAVLTCFAALAKRVLNRFENPSAFAIVMAALLVAGAGWAVGLAWARLIARAAVEGRPVANAHTLAATAYGTAALGVAALALALTP